MDLYETLAVNDGGTGEDGEEEEEGLPIMQFCDNFAPFSALCPAVPWPCFWDRTDHERQEIHGLQWGVPQKGELWNTFFMIFLTVYQLR